jgi:DNA-binding transcriptional regulator YdaS (Cro superfamily)
MEKGRAELSANEAITLRRIAYGVTSPDSLRPADIDQQKRF